MPSRSVVSLSNRKRTGDPPVRVSGIESQADRQGAVEAVARAFNNPAWMEEHLELGRYVGETYDPRHTRVAVANGKVVAAVVLAERVVRFGPVTIPAMSVGPVGTHDKYRKHGYAAAAMEDASQYMRKSGYLLAYLQGIREFYYRFGYYPFMAPSTAKFARADAQKQAAAGRLRYMTRKDLPAVRRIYDRATAARTMSAVRDRRTWDWLLGPGGDTWMFYKPQLMLDGQGRICGYLTTHPRYDMIAETVVAPEESACQAALGALCREARRREMKDITIRVPWDDAFGLFLRQYVGAEFTMRSNATGGALMKIVDFPALMRRLQPLLAQRWRQASLAEARQQFTLASEIGAVGVATTRKGVQIGDALPGRRAFVPQRWLSGLLTGYYTPADVARSKGSHIPPALLPALTALFPAGWAFIYQGDNY